MLAHNESKQFGNWPAIVKQFERDFKLFLSMGSKDIREMAIVSAGNKVIGKQEDIIKLIDEKDTQFLWVLINHNHENKISSQYLLPFLLMKLE